MKPEFFSDEVLIGRSLEELETPAVCVDLDALERNLKSVSEFISRHTKVWRPHVGSHLCADVARREVQVGAVGVTVADLFAAEAFLRAGISDVLIDNLVVGARQLERLARVCELGRPAVACDHYAQAEAISQTCRRRGLRCRVLIQVNLGQNRTGIRPGSDAADLARGVSKLQLLDVVGMIGSVDHLASTADRREQDRLLWPALSLLEELRNQMQRDGIDGGIVAVSGVHAPLLACSHPVVTEIHFGAVFGNVLDRQREIPVRLEESVTILATVLSRPKLDRAVLDVGERTVGPAASCRITDRVCGPSLPDVEVTELSLDHLILRLGCNSQNLVIGDKVVVTPESVTWLPLLHNRFCAIRSNCVKELWQLVPRGARN